MTEALEKIKAGQFVHLFKFSISLRLNNHRLLLKMNVAPNFQS